MPPATAIVSGAAPDEVTRLVDEEVDAVQEMILIAEDEPHHIHAEQERDEPPECVAAWKA